MRRLRRGILVMATAVAVACANGATGQEAMMVDERPDPTPTDVPTSMTPAPTSTPSSTSSLPIADPGPAEFTGEVSPVDEALLGSSWRADCPVAVDDLRLITVAHHGFGGDRRVGEMVVHADHADALLTVFERLYDAGFPIERMELITTYDGDDQASMRANNSSGFNCRVIDGTSRWSQHAYGTAVDINPLINPWARGSTVDPPEGAAYVDREAEVDGLIRADDVVVQAFESIGWSWGGYWNNSVDYQHFSANGR